MKPAEKKLVIKILVSVFLLTAVLVGSKLIDVFIQDWKSEHMCKEVYSKDGENAVQECLQREADRQVKNEK